MNRKNAIRNAVRYALCAGVLTSAAGYTPTAAAQEDEQPPEELEEITVTGTRIARQDYFSASPISTVDAELFEQSAAPTIEKVLNTLPQFVPALTSTSNNPSNGGQANVSLRGLGTQRTLVLLDGRRIVPSNATGVVDLNLIPSSVIDSVEIITGGASAVYGSDAIAGVVNIKTRNFVGLELSTNYGITAEDDGEMLTLGVSGGVESDDGRAYAFGTLTYADREEVLAGARDFASVALAFDGTSFAPVGSSTIRQGRIDAILSNPVSDAALDAYFAARVPGYTGAAEPGHNFGFNPDGSLFDTSPVINFTGDTSEPNQPVNPAQYTYNFAPSNYLQLPLERKAFFGRAGFELTEETEMFTQLLWADYSATQQLAPTPATGLYVLPDNPNLAPGVAALLATRPDPTAPFAFRKRLVESGDRIGTDDYQVVQFMVGANGSLPFGEDWNWDAYGSWGNVDSVTFQQGNVSRSAFEALSLAPDHGASICGAPINPFGINSISPECAAFFTQSAINNTTVNQVVGEAFVTGPLFELPAGEVQSAFGVMYKRDEFAFLPDPSLRAESIDPVFGNTRVDIVGFNAAETVRGETNSKEVYLEASFPLLADMPFVRRLDAVLGYRYADHSTVGGISSYKAEFTWAPSEMFMFRGGYQRAVRAPNISELFRPAVINFPPVGLGDPCSNDFVDPEGNVLGAQQDPRARALCIAQGIPAGAIDSFVYTNQQFQGLSGGNPDLSEETADTYTLGAVFQGDEGMLDGFSAAVDYYSIEIEDAISSIDADVVVERCFDPRFNPEFSADNFYCTFFDRLPGTGTITEALEVDRNIASFTVEGVDVQADYSTEVGPGQFRTGVVASYLITWDNANIQGEDPVENAGTASSGFDVLPEWKATANVGYGWNGFDGDIRWRYVGETTDFAFPGFTLDAVSYIDADLSYTFSDERFSGLTVRVGGTNLTDEPPVIYPSSQQSNTDPSTYDVLGRRYYVAATYRFE